MRAALCVAIALAAACGTPPRPVGLPAPEYEDPRVEPWSPPATPPAGHGNEPPPGEPPPDAAAPPAPSASVEPAPAPAPTGAGGSGATLPAGTP